MTPYLFRYDMMVLAIPVAYLVRLGLAGGFLRFELPALVAVLALCLISTVLGVPVGLAVNRKRYLLFGKANAMKGFYGIDRGIGNSATSKDAAILAPG